MLDVVYSYMVLVVRWYIVIWSYIVYVRCGV
jgi:hypothetical protein